MHGACCTKPSAARLVSVATLAPRTAHAGTPAAHAGIPAAYAAHGLAAEATNKESLS